MCREAWNNVEWTFLHSSFSPRKQCRALPPQFSHHDKGFINYVFCRNLAVRNPAGTRLDSSLVNKQVGQTPEANILINIGWSCLKQTLGCLDLVGGGAVQVQGDEGASRVKLRDRWGRGMQNWIQQSAQNVPRLKTLRGHSQQKPDSNCC